MPQKPADLRYNGPLGDGGFKYFLLEVYYG